MSISTYLSAKQIADQVQVLAQQINQFYQNRVTAEQPLILITILKGSTIFYADLVRQVTIPCISEFISISSYGNDTESSGQVRFELDTRQSITRSHVLIIEDIIDTGNSLHTVLQHLRARHPLSLEIVTLLSKPDRRQQDVSVKFIGFIIPDHFVIGYGLDYAERYRELPYIGIYNEEK